MHVYFLYRNTNSNSKNTNSNSNKILLYKDFRNSLNSELLKKVKISTNDKLINVLLNRY